MNPSVNVFLTGIWDNNLESLYVYTKIEPVSKFIIDNKNQVFPCWRKNFQIGEGGRLKSIP